MGGRPSVAWGARGASGLSGLTLGELSGGDDERLGDRVWAKRPLGPDPTRGSHQPCVACTERDGEAPQVCADVLERPGPSHVSGAIRSGSANGGSRRSPHHLQPDKSGGRAQAPAPRPASRPAEADGWSGCQRAPVGLRPAPGRREPLPPACESGPLKRRSSWSVLGARHVFIGPSRSENAT